MEIKHFPQGEKALPDPCKECQPEDQKVLWRAFTPSAFESFEEGIIPKLPEELFICRDRFGIPHNVLDVPGVLWTSEDPIFSLAVGLSRAFFQKCDIRLLGFTQCAHQIAAGSLCINTINRDTDYLVFPWNPRSKRNIFSAGIVVRSIFESQINGSILHFVDYAFIENLQAILKGRSEMNISSLISSALYDIVGDDLELSSSHVLPQLLRDPSCQENLKEALHQNVISQIEAEEARKRQIAELRSYKPGEIAGLVSELHRLLSQKAAASMDERVADYDNICRRMSELQVLFHRLDIDYLHSYY